MFGVVLSHSDNSRRLFKRLGNGLNGESVSVEFNAKISGVTSDWGNNGEGGSNAWASRAHLLMGGA